MPTETWKPSAKFPDRYEISTWSRVRNIQTKKYLKSFLATGKKAHLAVSLTWAGGAHNLSLSKLVAETFLGPSPKGTRLAFRDGNRQNCRKVNLYYEPYIPHESAESLREKGQAMSPHEITQAIWKALIPETQYLLKKYDLLADAPRTHTHGEYGISSRYLAEKVPQNDG